MKNFIYFFILLSHFSWAQMSFDDPILQKIYDYRIQVKESAFKDTLKLCIAYRKMRGLGIPQVHHISGEYSQHEDPVVREWAQKLDTEYGEIESASLQAWFKIIKEGAIQPVSALFGLKADFNDSNPDLMANPFSVENIGEQWLYSLYSIFLTESDEFFDASFHCLADLSMENIEEEMIHFQSTILFFDSQAGGQTYNALFWTGEAIFALLFRGISFAFRPLSKRVVSSVKRWNQSLDEILKPRFSNYQRVKKVFAYSAIASGTGLGVYLGSQYIKEKNREKQELQDLFQSLMAGTLED